MFEDHISRQVLPVLLLLDLEFIFPADSLLTKAFVQKLSESSTEPQFVVRPGACFSSQKVQIFVQHDTDWSSRPRPRRPDVARAAQLGSDTSRI
jgi:hypothetical protein